MIDIHSHLIYGVDDGPATVKDSIRMILEAEKLGIKAIVATPHYHDNLFNTERAAVNLEELRYRTKGCGVDLYLGSEVFISPFIPEKVRGGRSLTLNGSKYLLIELPFDTVPVYTYDTIYRLHLENIIPIIAHPERTRALVKNFGSFISLIEKGCLVQIDAASIIGVYGARVKSFTKRLIKLNLAHMVASDAHCDRDYAEWYHAAYRKVIQWAGEEYADRVFNKNPAMILNDLQEDDMDQVT